MPPALRRIAPLAVSSKGGLPRCIGRTKGGLNSKLHAVLDGQGRSVRLHLTAGQISDFDGARTLLPKLPAAQFLLPDKGYDANWFREGLSLGMMYDAGVGVKKDFALAAKWFRKAVDQGHSRAQYNLGNMYRYGDGMAKDTTEAAKLYQLAADKGHVKALNNLADLYYRGDGVSQNLAEAGALFEQAAVKGHKSTQFNLALMYRDGRGVTQNLVLAHMWLNIARENGVGKAAEKMAAIEGAMSEAQINAAVQKAGAYYKSKYKTCE